MHLDRSKIFASALPHIDVDVVEWGGTVRVQAFSVGTRLKVMDVLLANNKAVAAYKADQAKDEDEREGLEPVKPLDDIALVLIHALVTPAGDPIFTMDDHDRFADLSYTTLEKLWVAHANLSINPPTVEAKKKSSGRILKS